MSLLNNMIASMTTKIEPERENVFEYPVDCARAPKSKGPTPEPTSRKL
jgi:hypothetical protein